MDGFSLFTIVVGYFCRISWSGIIEWRESQLYGFLGPIMLVLLPRFVFLVKSYLSKVDYWLIKHVHIVKWSKFYSLVSRKHLAFFLSPPYGSVQIWSSFLFCELISFQLVVEKMLASEGIKRTDLSRDDFTKRVWEWKEKYFSLSCSYLLKIELAFLRSLICRSISLCTVKFY